MAEGRQWRIWPFVAEPETIEPVTGTIYCGDNLAVLNDYATEIPRESVDLIYLDPPFNSQRTFNEIYRGSEAQQFAFKDSWSWDEAAPEYARLKDSPEITSPLRALLRTLHDLLVDTDSDQLAYLVMMAPRLAALRRVLKATGSLYLHCDPTASHYLKVMLDAIFGPGRFLNEIVWKRTHSHGDPKRNFGSITDTILLFTGSDQYQFFPSYRPFASEYASARFSQRDADGRAWQSVTLRSPNPRPNLVYEYTASNGKTYTPHANGWSCDVERMREYDAQNRLHFPSKAGGQLRLKMYLDESKGVKIQSLWDDIPPVNSQAQERLGYPTQKPLALMERILATSSQPGDVVLDPFCGCGTTIEAAERMGRRWIGIDVARRSVELLRLRFDRAGLATPDVVWHPADPRAG